MSTRAAWAVRDWVYAVRWQVRSLGPTTADDYLDGDRPPVVVIPGVYETWHFMRPLMDALHDRGHPVHVLPVLRHNVRPVPASAEEVVAYLEEHDLREVLLVAHSKGGLIGKYAMASLDPDRRIDRMVAVSTPFGGSSLARLAPVAHLRVFRAADPVLAAMGRELAVNARITSVYGVFDTLIPEGSELAGATNVRLPVGGHFRILGDSRTREAVLAATG
ncbi:acetyltransferase and hydrolase with the alpha/beta hydrolase fold protein [Curtobacterium luteum]|uniref:Acetyltransferase and hydrolase with the alpha/beta hydrolase fold protein n=1 Tax=Curtobacterium luteum TaxID=33881 RepID=A0A175RKP1_9MICO|nr:acetyltransferase and hydrolase with the alpha/beta hydrolase fold protein [Curtobacterium luteum]